MADVAWQSWNVDVFARARAEAKPVLLSITASWCGSSRLMDCTTFADPHVAASLNDRFLPIRVDADRRPDISERYSLGGWPTTAFLTGDGEVLGGGTFVSLDRMPAVLERVLIASRSRDAQRPSGLATSDGPGAARQRTGAPDAEALRALVFDSYDAEFGGFGGNPKFPLIAPLDLALQTYRDSRDRPMAHIVEKSLDAMGWGPFYDDVDGGFFRCATRDWQSPRRAKMIDVNGALAHLYIDAAETLRIARYKERALDVIRYVQTWLADPVDGGWLASQHEDDEYYLRDAEQRRSAAPPGVDATCYAGWNGLMCSAALRAAYATQDTGLGEFALRSLERVLLACYRPGGGVAHYIEGPEPPVRGLLDDQILMAAAQLDAFEATGNIVYQMMAQELIHYAIRTMWDEAGGGFFDRTVPVDEEHIGLMRDRLKPFATNCQAVRVMRRLADACGDHEFAVRADEALAAMAPLAAAQGPLAAHFLLATTG